MPHEARRMGARLQSALVSIVSLRREALRELAPDDILEETPGSVVERELLRETGLEENADAKMARDVCHGGQRPVFGDAKLNEIFRLRENEEAPDRLRLDFSEFATEILDQHLADPVGDLHRLFADESKATIERADDLFLQEDAGIDRLLDIGVLRRLAELLEYLRRVLFPLAEVAQQHDEEPFRIFDCHEWFSLVTAKS